MAKSNVSMKLLIDKSSNKVLFAEAGKDTVDFLFSLLALPMGTVISLLGKQNMVGCIANLYESVESIDKDYIQHNQNKNTLLKPKVLIQGSPLLMIDSGISISPAAKKVYRCGASGRNTYTGYCDDDFHHNFCPSNELSYIRDSYCGCGYTRHVEMKYVDDDGDDTKEIQGVREGGFVKSVVTYMVMDNLVVKPISTISSITLLNKFNIKDVAALDEKIVHLDMDMALMLLKESLNSSSVLTTVFLGSKSVKP